jgi:hypothetical protein
MDKTHLQTGINLGGWLSQYSAYDHAHFQTFITQADIRRIADWGFDHVRLPVDYPLLECDQQPGVYLESGFEYIENCLAWCRASGLKVVLDLHKAPGYAFHDLQNISLFDDPSMQQRLINLWDVLAKRLGAQTDLVALELLNEVALPDSAPWNALYPRLVAKIRETAPHSLIIIGGNKYNAIDQLQYMRLLDDPRILYTFHYYLPMVVTHYHAPWVPWLPAYGKLVTYPGSGIVPDPGFFDRYSGQQPNPELAPGVYFDKSYLAGTLAPATSFARHIGQPVYCGEFGVIDRAPMSNRLNWMRDFISLLLEHDIGHALWSYKGMDFGLVNEHGDIVFEELIHIASMRKS